jgi:hypothetical protein
VFVLQVTAIDRQPGGILTRGLDSLSGASVGGEGRISDGEGGGGSSLSSNSYSPLFVPELICFANETGRHFRSGPGRMGGGGDPGARSGFIDEVSPHCLPRDGQFILIMPLTLHLAAESL